MAANLTQWTVVQLFCIEYPMGDKFGEFMAHCSLIPFGIITAFFVLSVYERDFHILIFFAGQLLDGASNQVLKKIIRQPRPLGQHASRAYTIDGHRSFGMPSQHAQFQAFFTFYATLFILNRLYWRPKWQRLGLSAGAVTLLTLVIYSRVYLEYHSWSQVWAGLGVGSLTGAIWYAFVTRLVEPYFAHAIINSWIGNFFDLKNGYPRPKPKSGDTTRGIDRFTKAKSR